MGILKRLFGQLVIWYLIHLPNKNNKRPHRPYNNYSKRQNLSEEGIVAILLDNPFKTLLKDLHSGIASGCVYTVHGTNRVTSGDVKM